MIARLVISPGALRDLQVNGDEEATDLLHESLLQLLYRHGALVFQDGADSVAFSAAIRELSADTRKRWDVVLGGLFSSHRMIRRRPPLGHSVSEVRTLEMLRDDLMNQADLLVVDVTQASQLGVTSSGAFVDRTSSVEVTKARSLTRTATLKSLMELGERANHACGTPREAFWDDVLSPLAMLSTDVVIQDRFLFRRILEGRAVLRNAMPEHVCWLLEHLDQSMMPDSVVTLIGDDEEPLGPRRESRTIKAEEVATVIDAAWNPAQSGRLQLVTAVTAKWRHRGSVLPHDRHVRFNIDAAVRLSQGFDRLARPLIEDPDGLNWQFKVGGLAVRPLQAEEDRILSSRPPTVSRATVLERQAL